MQFPTVLRIIGMLLMAFSFTQLPPIFVDWVYHGGHSTIFLKSFLITFMTGLLLWVTLYRYKRELQTVDGFLIVTLLWFAVPLFSGLPFILSDQINATWVDAFFESTSGLTTTGATIFSGLDNFPKSILYYRSQLQFLGGMGIIVLAVAILPTLGIGGLQLLRAEMSGPIKDSKFTPRVKETAKNLWMVYVGMTLCCLSMLWVMGMPFFDAICYTFSIVSTGGFAPHDSSLALYAQPDILFTASFFMILASLNFALHYVCINNFTLKYHIENSETRWLIAAILVMVFFFWYYLSHHVSVDNTLNYWWRAAFQVISAATTTGLITENFAEWPQGLPLLLLLLGVVGGCAGSTTGGLKIIRVLLLSIQGSREVKKLIHPSGKFPLKLDKKVVSENVVDAVWGFFCDLYSSVYAYLCGANVLRFRSEKCL